MRLVVDTNRIIAALIKNSFSRKIIMSRKFELVTINFAVAEVKEHKKEIVSKANLSDIEFDKLLSVFFGKIYIVEDFVIKNQEKRARGIMDAIDSDDSPFIALAMSIDNDGIWSDDRHFTKQNTVKIWKTEQLIKFMK